MHPLPDTAASNYLRQDTLPDLGAWRDQFAKVVNGSYVMRNIEMTVTGTLIEHLGKLTLAVTAIRPALGLAPLQAPDVVQWGIKTQVNRPMADYEASASTRLSTALTASPAGTTVQLTGPLKNNGAEFFLEVRKFEIDPA